MKLTAKRNSDIPLGGRFQEKPKNGGANRDRTGDLLLAKQALSQLSYGPSGREFYSGKAKVCGGSGWT